MGGSDLLAVADRRSGLVRAAFAGAVILALAGCETIGGSGGGDSFALGENLVGESCRAERINDDVRLAVAGLQGENYGIFCGDWEQPSATLIASSASNNSLESALSDGPWRSRLDLRAVCEGTTATTVLDGDPALALDCSLRNGGWPYSAFATSIGGQIFRVEGIPAAQPVAEAAIAVLSGRRDRGSAAGQGQSAAVARLEEQLAGKLFGTGDLQDYQLLLRVGSYYNGRKNFAEAEKRYRQALEIHERVLGADDPEYSDPLMHLAVEVSNQERFRVASHLFTEASKLVNQTADPADKARFFSYLAIHNANQRKYDEALTLARLASKLRREIASSLGGLDQDSGKTDVFSDAVGGLGSSALVLQSPANVAALDLAQSLGTEAGVLLRVGDPEGARAAVAEALGVVNASVHVPEFWRPQILELSAQVSLAEKKYAIAEQQIETALAQRRALGPQSRTTALGELLMGAILLEQGNLEAAAEAYERGFAIFRERGDSLRAFQVMPYLDALWDLQSRDAGQAAALSARMFDAAQLVRGAVAAQNISEASARLAASDREVGSIIRQLQDARRERDRLLFRFNAAASRAVTAEDKRALDGMRRDIREAESLIAGLEPRAQAAAPNLNLLRDNASGAEETLSQLRAGEALVQFVLGEEYSYAFLLAEGAVQAARIDLTQEIMAQAVQTLREAFVVQRTAAGAEVRPFQPQLAHLLYQRLLGPFDATLARVEHLITVPSGPLLSLPMGLLVTARPPEVNGFDYSQVAFLLKRSAVSLAPSVRAFVDLRSKARASKAPKRFLGLGDFIPSGDPDAILSSRGLPEACRDGALAVANAPRLGETADQIRAMAATFGAAPEDVVLGDDFNEENIASLSMDEYRVVVMATHGLLPGELDCLAEPAMVVSRPAGSAETSDGLLTYSEIFDLKLDADVVVLSACNTGGPLSQSGEATTLTVGEEVDSGEADRARDESLAGLARAFFYAGARSLLVSNWEVYTEATVTLMTRAFANLQDNGDGALAPAIRQAKLSFINNPATSHPYLWGSFALIGDGGVPNVDEPKSEDSGEPQRNDK